MSDPVTLPEDREAVIGLEVHVQLATASKMFCRCPAVFGAEPNTLVCEICTGQPGTLPLLNGEALRLGLLAALALGCRPSGELRFDRKNYFHPDLPKGYQITQETLPLASGGELEVELPDGSLRRVGIAQVHLEEDSGRLLHPEGMDFSLVDLNRCGLPLLEVVTEPHLSTPAEAVACLAALRRLLRYVGVGRCDMERAQLRCDVNLSLRRKGSQRLGTRTETKNLNGYHAVEQALEAELARQASLLEGGLEIVQQTMGLDTETGRTVPLRGKEDSGGYRCFPEPDLPVLPLDPAWLEVLEASLPEPAAERARRYEDELGLPDHEARALVAERSLADAFDALRALECPAHTAATWLLGEVLRLSHQVDRPVDQLALTPPRLAALIGLVEDEILSRQAAYGVAEALEADPEAEALATATRLDLLQINDEAELAPLVEQVLASEADLARRAQDGQPQLVHALVGAVMQASGGRANPKRVQALLDRRLSG